MIDNKKRKLDVLKKNNEENNEKEIYRKQKSINEKENQKRITDYSNYIEDDHFYTFTGDKSYVLYAESIDKNLGNLHRMSKNFTSQFERI